MIDFPRYLAANKTVDDRALNRLVWERLKLRVVQKPHPDIGGKIIGKNLNYSY